MELERTCSPGPGSDMFSGGPGRDFLRAHLNTTDLLPKCDEAREHPAARDAMLDPLATKCSS